MLISGFLTGSEVKCDTIYYPLPSSIVSWMWVGFLVLNELLCSLDMYVGVIFVARVYLCILLVCSTALAQRILNRGKTFHAKTCNLSPNPEGGLWWVQYEFRMMWTWCLISTSNSAWLFYVYVILISSMWSWSSAWTFDFGVWTFGDLWTQSVILSATRS